MGIFRVIGSVATGGIVDARSRSQRQTRYARQSRDALQQMNERDAAAARADAAPPVKVTRGELRAAEERLARVQSVSARMRAGEISASEASRLLGEINAAEASD